MVAVVAVVAVAVAVVVTVVVAVVVKFVGVGHHLEQRYPGRDVGRRGPSCLLPLHQGRQLHSS